MLRQICTSVGGVTRRSPSTVRPRARGRRGGLGTAAAVAAGACLSQGGAASAAPFTYYWDPLQTSFASDGSGPWDTTTPIWYSTGNANGTDAPYNNDLGNVAIFGAGSPGPYVVSVNQASGIQVGTINFVTSGYNVTGGAVTFGNAGFINTASGVTAYVTSAVNSNVSGSASSLTINGPGTLTLDTGAATTSTVGGFFVASQGGSSATLIIASGTIASTFYTSIGQYGTGTVNMTGGTLTDTGDFNLGNQNGALGILNLSGTATVAVNGGGPISNGNIAIGQGTAGGIVNQAAGTVTQGNAADPLYIGAYNPASVGVWNIAGGSVTTTSVIRVGDRGSGAMYISGGSVSTNNYARVGGSHVSGDATTYNVLDVSGGSFNETTAGYRLTVGEYNNATVNVRGTGSLNVGNLYEGGGGADPGTTSNNGQTAIVNLLSGGTITTGSVGANTNGTKFFDFNGGTLVPTVATTNYFTGLTAAYVYGGGAVFNTGNASVTVAQSLLAPTGNGVSSVAVSGGTGYLAAPIVVFTGGSGNGASGIATLDASGNLTGITITNPGQGYTSAPTVTLVGITAAGPGNSSSVATAVTGADTSGGLTKLGGNTLTLSANNSTFTGNVNVNAGTLSAGGGNGNGAGPLGATTAVARTVTVGTSATPAALNFTGGDTIGAGGGTSLVSVTVNPASTFTISASGSGNSLQNLNLNGGTVTTGTGYSIAYPTLTIGGNVTVGGTAASTITSSVGLSNTTGKNNVDLGFAGGTYASTTFAVPDVTGSVAADLTVSAPLGGRGGSGTAGGVLNKAGAGTLVLSGVNFYTGGTNVTAGTLQANAPLGLTGTTVANSSTGTGTVNVSGGVLAGTGGTGAVVVASGGTITGGTGATTADGVGTLTTAGQTWNASGSFVDKALNLSNTSSGNDRLILSSLTINATTGTNNTFNISVPSIGGTQTFTSGGVLVLAVDTDASASNPFNTSNFATTLTKLNLSTPGLLPAPGGDSLNLSSQADSTGSGGFDLILADVAATPEPTSVTLLAMGAGPLLARRRRRVIRL